MSYFQTPRLIFSGDFYANPSTVNNDQSHYNNAAFEPSFQEFNIKNDCGEVEVFNGWWNPEGGAVFDFRNCTVQEYELSNGEIIKADDELIGGFVKGAEGRATGKIVDLDPDMQISSQLWGVKLLIYAKNGDLLLKADIDTTPFRNEFFNRNSAHWVAVLKNISWHEKAEKHRFLKKFKEVASQNSNQLSLNLNVYGYEIDKDKERFTLGKIIGAIGPWFEGEPHTLAPCRRLIKPNISSHDRVFPLTEFHYDAKRKYAIFDFGQSFPVTETGEMLPNTNIDKKTNLPNVNYKLVLAISTTKILKQLLTKANHVLTADQFTEIGPVDYGNGENPNWLQEGGYARFDNLSKKIRNKLTNQPVVLLNQTPQNEFQLLAYESQDGYIVEADHFVQRLDTGDKKTVKVYAYQWGQPATDVQLKLSPYNLARPNPQARTRKLGRKLAYLNGDPIDGVHIKVKNFKDGVAILKLKGNKIDFPRILKSDKGEGYIDGQLYYYNFELLDKNKQKIAENISAIASPIIPAPGYPLKQKVAYTPSFAPGLNIHLRSYFAVPDSPTWDDIAYTMTQYSNLYPVMSKYIVDLSDEEAVKKRKDILIFAFSRPIADPLHMPATRDLSAGKRATILKWLRNLS